MKIVGVIPARGGSKGIPKKNIKVLNGKPLIAYTIEVALQSKLDHVVVSTDSVEIADVAKMYGAEVIMRPDALAQDNTPTQPVLLDVLEQLEYSYEAVMTLQPTSPLRTISQINESIELFVSDKEADSLVSVTKVPHNFMPEKLMDYDGKYVSGDSKVKRRQDVQTMYARNGAAIYITKSDKLNEYIFGGKILPYFMNKIDSFDIDDIEDWNIVECLIKSRQ